MVELKKYWRLPAAVLFAFSVSGISTPRNYSESVTIPLRNGTYPIGSDRLCLDVSTEKRLKSSLEIEISSRYCTQKAILSTGRVIFPAVNFRDRMEAKVDLYKGSIKRITQVKR